MPRRVLLFVLIALMLALIPAAACGKTLVSFGDEQIYIGPSDYPYDATTARRFITSRASQSLCLFDDNYYYTQTTSYSRQTLKVTDVGAMRTTTIANVLFDPVYCQNDCVIYYVEENRPNAVMSYNPETGRKVVAYRSSYDIDYLVDSASGLLVGMGDGFELYDAGRKRLSSIDYDPSESTIRVFNDYHTQINADGELYVLGMGEDEPKYVSGNVTAAWRMDDYIYYLQTFSTSSRLQRYSLDNRRSTSVTRLYQNLAPSLVAVNDMVYMSNEDGEIIRYDLDSEELDTVHDTGAGYAWLEIAGDNIVVYDENDYSYLDIVEIEEAQPKVVYETVQRGSRGDVVQRLQQKLRDLGYLTSSADGIFGSGTEHAVRLLQFDMGYSDTGVASVQFQREIFESGAPTYKQFVSLRSGSKGIRIEELNTRLREKYYTKQDQLNEYDDDTIDAVERFQSRMGYRQNGNSISASQLKALFASSAPECDEYYTLSLNDNAPVVKRLNRRLRTLGYISAGHVNEKYSSYTVKAVKKFQQMIYFKDDGIADPDTQYELFSRDAPTPSPKPTPTPTIEPYPTLDPYPTDPPEPPEPEQAVNNSIINTMRTWMKNNLGGNYPKDYAVYTLQSRLAELGYMDDTDINSIYDHVTKRAVRSFQSDNGLNDNGNANKKTLAAMFLNEF